MKQSPKLILANGERYFDQMANTKFDIPWMAACSNEPAELVVFL